MILNRITMPAELRPNPLERTVNDEVARPTAYLSERDVENQVAAMLPSARERILTDIVAVLRNTSRAQRFTILENKTLQPSKYVRLPSATAISL